MISKINILLVEDDEDDYILTKDLLAEAFAGQCSLEWVDNYSDALERIVASGHDLFLFDYKLGEHTGLDLLHYCKQEGHSVPIILLTGLGDREVDLQAMEAGASDFLVKGRIDAQCLERSIRYALEQKRVENTLRSLTQQLENKNEELESAYKDLKKAQMQILQQEKMASIGQLAAGVAHEINNPIAFVASNLNSFRTYVQELLEFQSLQDEVLARCSTPVCLQEIDEKRRQLKVDYVSIDLPNLIQESLDGIERVQKIVYNLKSFSRIDEAEENMYDINAGLESTINLLANEFKYKAAVNRQFGKIPRLRCNPGQINQVFVNLLLNAAQAIQQQGEITIGTWADAGWLNISIADNGCGIPPAIMGRLFDPFFTTRQVGKGTGLGLSIAYDIVKKHDGEITVESEVGKGTRFTIKLPLR